ncbi:methyl-accepting chemotaxis protein [Paenibacillus sp. GbtcB18]|uniref:methyl-accepting chemotaxis protein n=1 Tax=Paenibacillus sp. GbtcB18 TaxID=2824763 RepID=UPI001C305C2A|nr:methyl-accepting chemotaxis protein [Paenibacillus sp. GbtcB18]
MKPGLTFKFRDLSLRIKISLLLLVITSVPLIAATLILMSNSNGYISKQTEENMRIRAEMGAADIDLWMGQKINAVEGLVKAHPEFATAASEKEVLPFLKNLQDSDPEMFYFAYIDRKDVSYGTEGGVTDVSAFQNVKNAKVSKKLAVTDILKDVGSKEDIIIIDQPILDKNGEYAGIIQAIVSPKQIVSLVSRIHFGEKGYAFLLSGNRNMLLHPDAADIGKPVKDIAPDLDGKLEASADPKGYLYADDGTVGEAAVAYSEVQKTGWKLFISAPKTEVYSTVSKAKTLAGIIIAVSVLLVILISILTSRAILRPLMNISGMMRKAAAGDLTGRLDVKGRDEMGLLNEDINGMMDSFSSILDRMKNAIDHMASSSEELTAISAESAGVASRTSQTANSTAVGAETQHDAAQQTAQAMEEMAIGIQKIAASSTQVAETSDSVRSEVNRGSETVQRTLNQMKAVGSNVRDSAGTIYSLQEKSAEIQKIASTISDIARQTNLLALNASIEAARAGEHGRGFAVVAGEVKKLAEQTSHSTVEIQEILDEIVAATGRSTQSIESSLEEVAQGEELMNAMEQSFRSIQTAILDVSAQIEEVSAATQEISAGTEEVSASSQEMVDISKQTLNQMQQVAQSMNGQLHSMNDISSSAESLSSMAEEMQKLASAFTIK